jgi:hypothetical protein
MYSVIFAVVLSVASMVATTAILSLVMFSGLRRLDNLTADDVLRDWDMQLALLAPEQRERARLMPPAEVISAMVRRTPRRWSAARAIARR